MSFLSLFHKLCVVDHSKQPKKSPVFEIVKQVDNKPPVRTLEQAIADAKHKQRVDMEEKERRERHDREFFEPYVKSINALVAGLAEIARYDDWYYALRVGHRKFYISRGTIYSSSPRYSYLSGSDTLTEDAFVAEIGKIIAQYDSYTTDSQFSPCPFCGSTSIQIEGDLYCRAKCNGCFAQSALSNCVSKLAAMWNKRAII